MRARYALVTGLATLVAFAASATAATAGNSVVVEADGKNRFKPDKLTVDVNQASVSWFWGGDGTSEREHNVRQDDKLFYSGEPTATTLGFNTFLPAGNFHYYCEVHGSKKRGMDGVVAVRPELGADVPDGFEVIWATGLGAMGHQFDVRYKVDRGKWKSWFKNTTLGGQAFGGSEDSPVAVKPNHTYRVQARTEDNANPKKRSDWSPALKVKT